MDAHLVPGVPAAGREPPHPGRLRGPIGQDDALLPGAQFIGLEFAVDLDVILLRHRRARMQQQGREVAVVREQQGARRVIVEPAHRKEPRILPAQQVENRRPAFRVARGAEHPARLVNEDVVARRRPVDGLAIDEHPVVTRVDEGAEPRDDVAIDRDAARRDERLGGPPRSDACGRQDFLEPNRSGRHVG